MTDVTDLILEDHKQLKELFGKLQSGTTGQRELLLPVMSAMLVAHSRAEESQVYPAVRDEAGDAEDVEHSQEEHAAAELALVKLTSTSPESGDFASALEELIEAVTHHMDEEESDVLPAMRSGLKQSRRDEIGAAFLAARAEHWGDRPGEASRTDLEIQARNADIEGRSSMSTEELRKAVEASAEL
jgi:iron-sulfur cluster repair protein YtfE (RIC family)